MRDFTSKMLWMLLAMMPFVLTSCDDDEEIAYTLEGTWEGDMFTESTWDGYTYAISYSELCFDRNPYRYASGTGYWIDYYSNAPWDYIANHTKWEVSSGRIRIHLIEEDTYFCITDYSLNDNRFRGRIWDEDDESYVIKFDLRHTSSPNWNSYRYYDEDYYYNHYYYGNETSFDADEDKPAVNRAKSMHKTKAPRRIFNNDNEQ